MKNAAGPKVAAFLESVRIATRLIKPPYFCIPLHGLAEQKYRERVYCYELYHQLRCCTRQDVWCVLSGAKTQLPLPIFRRLFNRTMPDFLLHVPSEMGANVVVMNINPITARSQDIERDVKALKRFTTARASSRQAICLIYGDGESLDQFLSRMREAVFAKESLIVMWHRHPGESADVVRV